MRKTMRRIFHDTRIHRNQVAHVFSLTSEDETSMYYGSLFRQQRRSVKTSKKKKRSARREVAQEEMKEKVIYTSRYIFMHRIYATISKIQLGGILCLGGLNVYTIYSDPNVDSTLASLHVYCILFFLTDIRLRFECWLVLPCSLLHCLCIIRYSVFHCGFASNAITFQ